MTDVFVGIDVGKYNVDVAIGIDGEEQRFKNDDAGVEQILNLLKGRRVGRVVLEASGGYERQVTAALLAAGIPAVAVNAPLSCGVGCRGGGRGGARQGQPRRARPDEPRGDRSDDRRASGWRGV